LKLVDPPVAESVTDAVPTHAEEAMLNVAVAELPFDVTLLKLRPGQVVESETLHKLLPDSVTTTLPPCAALHGLTEGTGGAGGGFTVTVPDRDTHGVLRVFFIAVTVYAPGGVQTPTEISVWPSGLPGLTATSDAKLVIV